MSDVDLTLPNLDAELWTFTDRALAELAERGIQVDDGLVDLVAALAARKFAERIGEIGREWVSMRRAVESAAVSNDSHRPLGTAPSWRPTGPRPCGFRGAAPA